MEHTKKPLTLRVRIVIGWNVYGKRLIRRDHVGNQELVGPSHLANQAAMRRRRRHTLQHRSFIHS